MEDSENQNQIEKKWYKKIRYWVLIILSIFMGIFVIAFIDSRGMPMLHLMHLPKEFHQSNLNVPGYNVSANENVKIYQNGNLMQEVKANDKGDFQTTLDLIEGENVIYMEALKNGKIKKSINYKFTYFPEKQVETKSESEKASESSQPGQQQVGVGKSFEITNEIKDNVDTKKEETSVDKINSIVKNIADDLEVTIWDTKNNFAKNDTPPPYDIIINAGPGVIADCYYAKQTGYEIMRKLWTNDQVKDKIGRVRFNSWGQLQTSVGSDDGLKTPWNMNGPTNYWKVMLPLTESRYEKGSLNQRTWGKYIDSDCYEE